MLEEAIASVRDQTFTELGAVPGRRRLHQPRDHRRSAPPRRLDPRIHLERRETAGGISTATNTALELATGEYIALLDHDDTLAPDALQHVADQIANQPDLDMIYSDEDIVLDGRPIWLHLKPGWSPDTLRTNGYTCHLGVYRRDLVRDIGGFRTEFNGSQDVDMILRLVERTDGIAHIPRVLYHWRAHASSTAGADAKPYAYVAARNAITAHLERIGVDAEVDFGPPGLYRVVHRVDPSPSVDAGAGRGRTSRGWLMPPAPGSPSPTPAGRVVLAAPEPAHARMRRRACRRWRSPAQDHHVAPPSRAPTRSPPWLPPRQAATAEHLLLMQTSSRRTHPRLAHAA